MQGRKYFNFPPIVLYENRYCNQDDLSVLVCGGIYKSYKVEESIFKLYGSKFECGHFTLMPNNLRDCKTAVINSDLFILGGFSEYRKLNNLILKFCNKTKTWSSKVQSRIYNNYFCMCSFKKNLYVINETRQCFVYNLKRYKWTKLADTKEDKPLVACTVFEGKIVISGSSITKSVEAYDYYENKWTYLSEMIERRCDHASVSMGNKLFVIGGHSTSNCEVFDSYSRKFTLISPIITNTIDKCGFQAVCVGDKILVFAGKYDLYETKMFIYDVVNDSWSENKITMVKNLIG